MFNEDGQLYFRWTMNFVEFHSWIHGRMDKLGEQGFEDTYPTFEDAYADYLKIIGAEEE